LWTALNGDTALTSSVKNLPTDDDPSTQTKIGSAPYVGALFLSQNSQTWTAEQNQALMFVVDRCVFNTSATPNIQYVIPAYNTDFRSYNLGVRSSSGTAYIFSLNKPINDTAPATSYEALISTGVALELAQ
jgi:hypothetical protein